MVSAPSHAFQRDLRGAGERFDDDFWGWREAMYALATSLNPDTMYKVALRAYTEMRAAGYGAVGEFHYVHHQPDGTPYRDPNAMARAVEAAANDAGLVIKLLPAAYHRAGWRREAEPGQRRFCDPDVETFLERVEALGHGVAAHSIRAVPAAWLQAIAEYSEDHRIPRHVHASEQ